MITYHPSVTKAAGNKGFRAMVQMRDDSGRLVGSRVSRFVFANKGAARNYAREVCNCPSRSVLEPLDQTWRYLGLP
jgi:hypothetical protein